MRHEHELALVVTGVLLVGDHLDLRLLERQARLGFLVRGAGRAVDILQHPVVEFALQLIRLARTADPVAHHAFQIMREAAAGEDVRQSRRQVRVRRCRLLVVGRRAMHRLRADEGRLVGVLAVDQRHQTRARQFGLAAIADRDLGRALLVNPALIGREGRGRQLLDRATRFDAADVGGPAVGVERLGDRAFCNFYVFYDDCLQKGLLQSPTTRVAHLNIFIYI